MPEIPNFVIEGAVNLARDAASVLTKEVGQKLFADTATPIAEGVGTLSVRTEDLSTRTPAVDSWLKAVNEQSAKWDKGAEDYPPIVAMPDPFQTQLERSLLENYAPAGKSDLRVLEIGPDVSSTVPVAFGDRMSNYTAVELSGASLKGFRQGMAEQGVDVTKNHTFIKANGVDLVPIPSESQDMIYVSGATTAQYPYKAGALQSDPLWTKDVANHALSEAARVLVPGGKMMLRPWSSSIQEEMDMSVFARHFKSMEVQRISPEQLSRLAPLTKDPDAFIASQRSYKSLVLTK